MESVCGRASIATGGRRRIHARRAGGLGLWASGLDHPGRGAGGSEGKIPCQRITDGQACNSRADCRYDGCTDFVRCANPDDPRLPCSVPPGANRCSMSIATPLGKAFPYCMTSTPWCHPIYSENPPPEVCPPPLDCATLVGCADNGTAQCVDATGTRCGGDPPSCASGNSPAINSAGCYEGCVPLSYCGG